jgi:LPS sulfotransferase NodH
MKALFKKLFGASDKQVITVVSGLPRSGTSLMMKMLEAGGLPVMQDGIREADRDNPKGYYEFERVKQMDKGDTAWMAEAQGKVVKIISALLKHMPPEYEYRVIFMRRHMKEVLASQRKMLVHRGEDAEKMDDEKMGELFEKHMAQVFAWLGQQPNVRYIQVHYNDLLADPVAYARQVDEFLDGRLDEQKMIEMVDPKLYRNRKE